MVWPIPVETPRIDVRYPTFNVGNFWGRVPHTRMAFMPTTFGNEYEWMNFGVILQSNEAPEQPWISLGNTYEGYATLDGIEWRFIYRWNYVAYPDVMGIQFTGTKLTPPTGTIFYRQTGTATMQPAATVTMPLFSNVPGWNPRPDAFQKFDLPEWVSASEQFPDAIVTEPA